MGALLTKSGGNPEADEKETTKSPEGSGDQNKIRDMKSIKIASELPKVSLSTESGALRSELLNVASQINSQTSLPMGRFLFDGGIYAYGVGKITTKNKREIGLILTELKSAGEVSADEAAAIKKQIMSYYPDEEVFEELQELSANFDKAHNDLINKLGVDKKDASEAGVSELIIAVVNLGTKAIELYGLQMEYEMKLLTLASNTRSILEFTSVEERYLAVVRDQRETNRCGAAALERGRERSPGPDGADGLRARRPSR